ncbi:MAG TPA: hypothetical protein VGJ87_03055 [Roseiflexaceae bacterium]
MGKGRDRFGRDEVNTRAVTVLYSTGAALCKTRRDDTLRFPSLHDLLEDNDIHNRTLFTVVDHVLVEHLIAVAQAIVGDFDSANTGILFTVPVNRALGLGPPP